MTPEQIARFSATFNAILEYEGAFASVQFDLGGETVYGISWVHNPQWEGWKRLEELKALPGFPASVTGDANLRLQAESFYFRLFVAVGLDQISDANVAFELFEQAVHRGATGAIKGLQRILNSFNKQDTLWDDLEEDGVFGQGTQSATEIFITTIGAGELIKWLNIVQGGHFLDIVRKRPEQEKFMRGWSRRIEFKKLT